MKPQERKWQILLPGCNNSCYTFEFAQIKIISASTLVTATLRFSFDSNIILSPRLRWCFSIFFSQEYDVDACFVSVLFREGELKIWNARKKRKEMGHILGSPKTSKTEDARVYPYCALPWSWYSQNVRRRKLWRHLPRRPVWETMDLKPNCVAKKSVNLWPQIRSQNVTPVLGSRLARLYYRAFKCRVRDPILGGQK